MKIIGYLLMIVGGLVASGAGLCVMAIGGVGMMDSVGRSDWSEFVGLFAAVLMVASPFVLVGFATFALGWYWVSRSNKE